MRNTIFGAVVGVVFLPLVFAPGARPLPPTPTPTPLVIVQTATPTPTSPLPTPTPTAGVTVGPPHPAPTAPSIDDPAALELSYFEDGSAAIYVSDGQRIVRVLAAACVRPEMGCTPDAGDSAYAIEYLYNKWDDHQPAIITFAGQVGHANDICTYVIADGEQFPLDHEPCW